MKCLIITPWCNDLDLYTVKGTPENAYLFQELTQRGIDTQVICPETPGFPKIREVRFSFIYEHLYDRDIFRLLKNINYDFAISITGLGSRALKKRGKPFFVKYLGAFDFFITGSIRRKLYHRRLYLSVKADPLAAVMTDDGTQGEKALRKAGYKKDILFLKNGYFAELLNLDRQEEDGTINIGFAASLELIKGVDFLIKIIETLSNSDRFRFIIAGEGTFHKKIEELAKKYPDKIEYMGYLPYLKMPEFYEKIDVLLSLNRYSNGTLPVVEAQAAGIPPIAFDIQETTKFIKHNVTGFLVEPFDIDSIVFLLRNIRKKQLRGMRKNIREFVLNTFWDMKRRAEKEVDFYTGRLNHEGS